MTANASPMPDPRTPTDTATIASHAIAHRAAIVWPPQTALRLIQDNNNYTTKYRCATRALLFSSLRTRSEPILHTLSCSKPRPHTFTQPAMEKEEWFRSPRKGEVGDDTTNDPQHSEDPPKRSACLNNKDRGAPEAMSKKYNLQLPRGMV